MVNAGQGIYNNFLGKPVERHLPEIPVGMKSLYFNVDVPVECHLAGMRVEVFEDQGRESGGHKIFCLYDRFGHITKQWPDDYVPSFEDIRQAVKEELFLKEGRVI